MFESYNKNYIKLFYDTFKFYFNNSLNKWSHICSWGGRGFMGCALKASPI